MVSSTPIANTIVLLSNALPILNLGLYDFMLLIMVLEHLHMWRSDVNDDDNLAEAVSFSSRYLLEPDGFSYLSTMIRLQKSEEKRLIKISGLKINNKF